MSGIALDFSRVTFIQGVIAVIAWFIFVTFIVFMMWAFYFNIDEFFTKPGDNAPNRRF